MIIVDASVAVKWLVFEDGAESARDLLGGLDELVVPDIALVEVPGAVLRKLRAGVLVEEEVQVCLAIWGDLLSKTLQVVPSEEVLEQAIRISMTCSHPLTDCVYVAAAAKLGSRLVTADVTLQQRCKRAYRSITLIEAAVRN